MSNTRAPKGKIYQCQMCGKKSKWSHGYTAKEDYCDDGFDVSCVMNSKLIKWQEDTKRAKVNET